jgi:serine/threonine-protein kinase
MSLAASVTASEHARVKALFNAVCDLEDPAEQFAQLQVQETDESIRRRVWAMLEADRAEATAFSAPVRALKEAALEADAPELKPGDRLGAWTLSAELGHGGMGRVYLAERSDGHYDQRAAIKLLLGWSTPDALAQLARERQILASLNHPHIARLIDGGTTPRGRPYLVMEYVDGERVDRYCEAQRLGWEARLALFEQVCTAVAHAHRQLIVHCDIKPGNVLVGTDGRAMLLDFGIAHLDGQDGSGNGSSAGLTPRYASPEQQAGEAGTPASDIFSLGRMLEELIKPLLPLPRERELLAIVARATAPRPADRYLDVSGLLADLRRLRQHLPLTAMPRSTGYLTGKWLRRRWPWVLVGLGAVTLSSGFTWRVVTERDAARRAEAQAIAAAQVAARAEGRAKAEQARAVAAQAQAETAQAQAVEQRDQADQARRRAVAESARADRERQAAQAAEVQAREEAATTKQVSDLLVGLFQGADPSVSGRPDLSATALVDKGRESIDRELGNKPELQAHMRGVLGRVYENMGRRKPAADLYDQALAQEKQPEAQAHLLIRKAMVLANDGQGGNAVEPARKALALRERLGNNPKETTAARDMLGYILSRVGQYDESRRLLERSLKERIALFGPQHREVATTLHHLGMLYAAQGQWEQAEARYREALAMKRAVLPENDLSVLNTVQSLAATLAGLMRFDEAEPLLRELVERRRQVLGTQSAPVAVALNELALVQQDRGRPEEAIRTFREAIAIEEVTASTQAVSRAVTLNNLATALEDVGDPQAETYYRRSLEMRQAALPAGDLSIARAQHNLGRWLLREGRLSEARALMTQALAARSAKLAPKHQERIDSEIALAEVQLRSGELAEAQARVQALIPLEPEMRDTRRITLARMQGLLATAAGDTGLALQRHQAAADIATRILPPAHGAQLRLRLDLAYALSAAGDKARATATLDAALPRARALPATAVLRLRAEKLQAELAAAR